MLADESKSDVDPAAAKIANDAAAHGDLGAPPIAAMSQVPVVSAVEIPTIAATHWDQRSAGGDKQVVCADVALKVSAGVLLAISSIAFCVGIACAHNSADTWRGILAAWGIMPQLMFGGIALTALTTQCHCEQRGHMYCAAVACILPVICSFISLSVAATHTRALERFDKCKSDDAFAFALGKEASRKIDFHPLYLRREASHLWYQNYCDFDTDCEDKFEYHPRRDFFASRFCMMLNDTASGRLAMETQDKRGICAARCSAQCNCYKTNADTKGDNFASYSACWEFGNYAGDCGTILTEFKRTTDTQAVFTSFSLIAGMVFVGCLFVTACIRPLVGTRVHFAPPTASVELPQLPSAQATGPAATAPESAA